MLEVVHAIAVVSGVALPAFTLWRFRSRKRRRDEWLSANAHPIMAAVLHGGVALVSIIVGGACALGAIAGYSFLWSPVIAFAGLLITTITTVIVARTAPADLH